jgi:hypothetical protein
MKKVCAVLFLGLLSACAAVDPSVNDVKSPCASADGINSKAPCVKRTPIENFIV